MFYVSLVVFVFLCLWFTLCPFEFCNYLDKQERAELVVCFYCFKMSCYCKCHVALPHGDVGWSTVCDCGIS